MAASTSDSTCRGCHLRCSVSGGLESFVEWEVLQLKHTVKNNKEGDLLLRPCDNVGNENGANSCTSPLSSVDISWSWITRGNSGSQLQIEISGCACWTNSIILHIVQQFRFVEYIYYQVFSTDDDKNNICWETATVSNNKHEQEQQQRGDIENDTNTPKLVLLEQIQEHTSRLLSGAIENNDRVSSSSSTLSILEDSIQVWKKVQTLLHGRDVGLESLPGSFLPTPEISDDHESDTSNKIANKSSTNLNQTTTGAAATTTTKPRLFEVNTIYTKPTIAKVVVKQFINMVLQSSTALQSQQDNILWLDAGAGSGALLQHLPLPNRIGIDTCPSHPNIHTMDFLKVTNQWLSNVTNTTMTAPAASTTKKGYHHLCIISNPPFAERSRGDYSAIVKFINHAIVTLQAHCIGLIVPSKFVRSRVWVSLGLQVSRIQLVGRFLIPTNAFYDPSSNTHRHINSYFVVFQHIQKEQQSSPLSTSIREKREPPSITIDGKRDKGIFPWITTAELAQAVGLGLPRINVDATTSTRIKNTMCTTLSSSTSTTFAKSLSFSAELKPIGGSNKGSQKQVTTSARLELYILLNPKQPLSLVNCRCQQISRHSLGWISTSVKPPVATAMLSLSLATPTTWKSMIGQEHGKTSKPAIPQKKKNQRKNGVSPPQNHSMEKASTKGENEQESNHHPFLLRSGLVVNVMCGEGTIELESQGLLHTSTTTTRSGDGGSPPNKNAPSSSFFLIAGDKSSTAVHETAERLASLSRKNHQSTATANHRRPLVDLVVWDAQNLPLRKGIVDAFLGDLPFCGSTQKNHQEPQLATTGKSSTPKEATEESDEVTTTTTDFKLPPPPSAAPLPILDYRRIMAHAVRVLSSSSSSSSSPSSSSSLVNGRAVFVSCDTKALSHAIGMYNGRWSNIWNTNNLNVGGLSAKLVVLEKQTPCYKDVSIWMMTPTTGSSSYNNKEDDKDDDDDDDDETQEQVIVVEEQRSTSPSSALLTMTADNVRTTTAAAAAAVDLSDFLKPLAVDACQHYWLDDLLELQEEKQQHKATTAPTAAAAAISGSAERITEHPSPPKDSSSCRRRTASWITKVELQDTFVHPVKHQLSHCYRFWFDDQLSNVQTKVLEKSIRNALASVIRQESLSLPLSHMMALR